MKAVEEDAFLPKEAFVTSPTRKTRRNSTKDKGVIGRGTWTMVVISGFRRTGWGRKIIVHRCPVARHVYLQPADTAVHSACTRGQSAKGNSEKMGKGTKHLN